MDKFSRPIEGEPPFTVAQAIDALSKLSPDAALITERSCSDRLPVKIVPQDGGKVLIW